LSEGTRG
jgi:alpha-beta hydrolase superfamily lysophospholipase